MEYHEFASVFPLMAGEDLDAMVEDVRVNGLHEPIMLFEGKILDGRNRHVACTMAGIAPRYRDFTGTEDQALAFVWSENFHRRDLSPSQRAACIIDHEGLQAKLRADAEDRKQTGKGVDGSGGRGKKKNPVQKVGQGLRDHSGDTDTKLAAVAGTNRQYVSDMRKIKSQSPEEHEAVKRGAKRVSEAKRDIQREEKKKRLREKADTASKAGKAEWQIIHGDCLAELPKLSGTRLIVADPPYNIGVDYGPGAKADQLPREDYLFWCADWIRACRKLLTDDGSLWVIICDEWADEFAFLLTDAGLHRRAWIKWYETFGVNCVNNFNRCSRHIFYYVVDPKRFVFNSESRYIRRASDRQAKYSDKRADPAGKLLDDVWQVSRLVDNCEERIPEFPTQIPLEITRRIVACASEPGDLVVDPFSGSGSTGHAALELHRRYVGIEKEERFWELSTLRLTGVTPFAPDAQ